MCVCPRHAKRPSPPLPAKRPLPEGHAREELVSESNVVLPRIVHRGTKHRMTRQ